MKGLYTPLLLILLFSSSCAFVPLIPPKQMYPGPQRPLEQIALLVPETGVYATFFMMEQEGQHEVPRELGKIENGRTLALLPGSYKAMVTYHQEIQSYSHKEKKVVVRERKYSITPGFIRFTVRAGERYRLRIEDAGIDKWRPILLDSSGVLVSALTSVY